MNMRQRIIDLAAKLRKQFPEQGGVFAVTVNAPMHTSLNEGFQGDPNEDTRPDFVLRDEAGWERIKSYNGK